ncbi:hypothetical protein [Amycolatopsis keratiniphila]|nr:hypothetical protein [Amycolatopsis keratiniphila]
MAVTALGVLLGLSGVSEGPSPASEGSDALMINIKGPICEPHC